VSKQNQQKGKFPMKYNSSLFSQILQIIPRSTFNRLVRETQSEHCSKGFSCWNHLVSMLFCQFAQSKSLREISDGLRVSLGKLNHLGIDKAVCKSTLAYANKHRTEELYHQLSYKLIDIFDKNRPGKKKKFRFNNPLFSMDASTIDLCLSLFPWADFRQHKGAVKLHTVLDHDGYLPTYTLITDAKKHEVKVAREFEFNKGSIVVIDRGYCDYELYYSWHNNGIYFVTRQKVNAAYEKIKEMAIPKKGNVLKDQRIRLTGYKGKKECPIDLRRVVVWDDKNKEEIILLTNNFKLSANTISEIYKDRWEIEIFFKTIKQNLKVKTFVGTSENALKLQIWTALISLLLLKYLQFMSSCGWAFCRLVAIIRLYLFAYRDLWSFLNDPFEIPPDEPPVQLTFGF
jgi:hypothetical protein